MSTREQSVELIQQRLMKQLKESKTESVRISAEDAVHLVFLLDIIRVMIRKMDEVLK